MERAWAIQDHYGLSWCDALIVSEAQSSGCRCLLTEDLQEGRLAGDVKVVNPSTTGPEMPG